ncbi:MAG: glycosyltransferase involved in cell wall biosynthesis [Saprospiraceae bacterium]|jgi:glycosyltransferase involved in cell wall biosynthesis
MTILFILEYYYPHTGGVETFFKKLVDSLDQEGHKIIIVTNQYEATLPALEYIGNVEIRRYRFYNRYLFTFGAWLVAWEAAKSADLIHTTSYNAALPSWIVAKLARKKSIITFHEVWGDLWDELPWMSTFSKRLHKGIEELITKLHFDRFVGVSDFTKNALIKAGVSSEKVRRIYNGIEYPVQAKYNDNSKNDVFQFLFFGRVSYSKGVDLLIEAMRLLKESKAIFQLKMIIPSEQTPLLTNALKLIKEYDLQDVIELQHDLPFASLQQAIAQADAVVIPSYSEGFCFAAVETMAIGTPIISSGKGALKEVISGKHIELASFDAPTLYEAMVNAIKGKWNSKPLRTFPLSDTIEEYLKLYKELLRSDT